jgi:hypothetical protein
MKYWPTKTPLQIRDRGLNWLPTLEQYPAPQPTIVDSSWDKLHGDADITSGIFNDTTTTARVIGGTAGQETVFRNTISLSNGEVLDEDVFQRVRA